VLQHDQVGWDYQIDEFLSLPNGPTATRMAFHLNLSMLLINLVLAVETESGETSDRR
jgi:hypothetical protein